MVQNCGLVYSIDRESLISQLLSVLQWEFVSSKYSDQMLISGEMIFEVALSALYNEKTNVLLMKLLKPTASLYSYNSYTHTQYLDEH